MWNKLSAQQKLVLSIAGGVLLLLLVALGLGTYSLGRVIGLPGLIGADPTTGTALIAEIARQASMSRWLLVVLMLLAAGLVAWVVWHLTGRLESQQQELDRHKFSAGSILSSVSDGLFLLDRQYAIGEQFSDVLKTIFNRTHFAGENFFELMGGLVTDKTISTTRDYLDLLFGERVNERLVQDLNPLDVVEFNFDEGNGQFRSKFLGFRFKRVFVDGKLSHLLVTVSDITKRIQIEQELRESREKTQAQMDMLVELLHVDPFQLNEFLGRAQAGLEEANRILREPATATSEYKQKVTRIFKLVHSVKGESGQIGLASFQGSTHELENILATLRNKPSLNGNDFLQFTVKLEDLFTQLDSVRVLLHRVGQLRVASAEEEEARASPTPRSAAAQAASGSGSGVASAAVDLGSSIRQLALQLAARYGKQVNLQMSGLEAGQVPNGYVLLLRDVMAQFTRNAIVHGIEQASVRELAGKQAVGTIAIQFRKTDIGFELVFRDDGEGLDPEKLRVAAVRAGKYTEAEAAQLEDAQLRRLVFDPDFTTAAHVDENAGRGVGLGMVRDWIANARGQLRLATAPGKGMQLKISLPPV